MSQLDPEQRRRVEEVFERAMEAAPEEWEELLERECAGEPAVLAELRALLRLVGESQEGTDPLEEQLRRLAPSPPPASRESSQASRIRRELERIHARSDPSTRYVLGDEVGRGGMGSVRRVHDRDFGRELAMKLALDLELEPGSALSVPQSLHLARFFEEAQITGQLDHPGIVPVHDLGLDAAGRVYFTMQLVRGRDLRAVYRLAHLEQQGWSRTRALGVLQKVCEAMAYAHDKGVVHRDLKPGNVMVGRYGEVYVMDWGLARVLDRPEIHVPGMEPGSEAAAAELESLVMTRRTEPDADSEAWRTAEGAVVGTPAYMPPEQAQGRADAADPRADVYAVGAMLYHLLAEHPPYHDEQGDRSASAVVLRVAKGPPRPIAELARDAAPELISICERAMERDPARRYATMGALADDLRAFLEDRVVRAHKTGALVELRKWVRRNRAHATTIAASLTVIVAGLAVTALVLERRANEILGLSALRDLERLDERARAAWPLVPETIGVWEDWIADAAAVVEGGGDEPGLEEYRRRRDAKLAALAAGDGDGDRGERWWAEQLERLVAGLEELADPETGPWKGHVPGRGIGVARRLASMRALEERTVTGADAQRRWAEAIAEIADESLCPDYFGLEIEPRFGWLPLRRDPVSGLWEFTHLLSGEEPEVDADGRLVFAEETGVVMVLVPAPEDGLFYKGAQADDGAFPNFDPVATQFPREYPPHLAEVEPFFLAKHELTQAQWWRMTAEDPSSYNARNLPFEQRAGAGRHPVETVSWVECERWLGRYGLGLPTESEWEWAARARTTDPRWPGPGWRDLEGCENVADRAALRSGAPWVFDQVHLIEDGFTVSSPVGSYRPNPFGLHDTLGNVAEWCADVWLERYETDPDADPDDSAGAELGLRAVRGAAFNNSPDFARATYRDPYRETETYFNVGVRPAARL